MSTHADIILHMAGILYLFCVVEMKVQPEEVLYILLFCGSVTTRDTLFRFMLFVYTFNLQYCIDFLHFAQLPILGPHLITSVSWYLLILEKKYIILSSQLVFLS